MNAIMHVSFNQGGVVAGCFLLEDWGGVTTDLVLSKGPLCSCMGKKRFCFCTSDLKVYLPFPSYL